MSSPPPGETDSVNTKRSMDEIIIIIILIVSLGIFLALNMRHEGAERVLNSLTLTVNTERTQRKGFVAGTWCIESGLG